MKKLKLLALTLLTSSVFLSCSKDDNSTELTSNSDTPKDFRVANTPVTIRSADVSFLPQIRSKNILLKKSSSPSPVQEDMLKTLWWKGCNTLRIRLWVGESGVSKYNEVKALIAEARNKSPYNFKIWLSIHYSDTWADYQSQPIPTIWKNNTYSQLALNVVDYTKKIMLDFNPEYVQMGNETNGGFLYSFPGNTGTGVINGAGASDPFIDMIKKVSAAITQVRPSCKKIIHYAGFGTVAENYFLYIKNNGIVYDYAAVSYYPTSYTGSNRDINSLFTSLENISVISSKPTLIAETAYPYTLTDTDTFQNVTRFSNQLLSTYPASPQGQKNFLLALRSKIKSSTFCEGFSYWGGDFVKGVDLSPVAFGIYPKISGSNYDNMSFYSASNVSQPVMDVFYNE